MATIAHNDLFFFCFEVLFPIAFLAKANRGVSGPTKLSRDRFRVLLSINLISSVHATVVSFVAIYGLFSDKKLCLT